MKTNPIKKIQIKGLFNKYLLDWDFLNSDVNILVGINGSGKSTILRSLDALLSRKYASLNDKKSGSSLGIKVTFSDETIIDHDYGIIKKSNHSIKHDFITTFDVPLKDKRSIGQSESPLDKELESILYTVGKDQNSFSNYRFKATNFPQEAKKINERINNFFSLINEVFSDTGKKININPEINEIYFKNNKSDISLSKLSSGEKQMLIILFTVFLMEEQPYILLMDEPEISLHISWQQKLIDIIRQLNPNCQLILSTHSPSIFGEGWGDKIFFTEDLITPIQ